jgi:ABC-type transport system involved in cytochrome bd biosynthesis fused ATPase/permease subunit
VALIGAGDRPPRALLASAAVLVLDRPTPPLDPRTASEVIKDVFAAAGNQTVFAEHPPQPGLDRVDRWWAWRRMK